MKFLMKSDTGYWAKNRFLRKVQSEKMFDRRNNETG